MEADASAPGLEQEKPVPWAGRVGSPDGPPVEPAIIYESLDSRALCREKAARSRWRLVIGIPIPSWGEGAFSRAPLTESTHASFNVPTIGPQRLHSQQFLDALTFFSKLTHS